MSDGYQDSPQPLKRLYELPTEHQLRHGRNGFQWTSGPERLTEFEEPIRGEKNGNKWIKYPIKEIKYGAKEE